MKLNVKQPTWNYNYNGRKAGIVDKDTVFNIASVEILDTNGSNALGIVWNEDDNTDRTLNLKLESGDRTIDLNENLTIGNGANVSITAEDAATAIVMDNANFEVENGAATQRLLKLVVGTDAPATLSVEGTSGTINQDVTSDASPVFVTPTLTSVKLNDTNASHALTVSWDEDDVAARTLKLKVAGADAVLQVEGISCAINQDVSSDASPAFTALDITNDVRARSLFADGDVGTGVVSTVAVTNVVDTAVSTGTGTILLKGAGTTQDSAGWLKIYVGTDVVFVPYFSNITGV